MTPSVLTDAISVSIAALAPVLGACELCATGGEALRTAVTVRHPRGASISLAACDRCATAMRRLIAVAGGVSATGPAYINAASVDRIPAAVTDSVSDVIGRPVLIHEFAEPFLGPDGVTYVVRAWAQGRSDGTWIGWLTFVGIDDAVVRKTPRETSQSSLEHVRYWASGLEPTYVEGAFSRSSP